MSQTLVKKYPLLWLQTQLEMSLTLIKNACFNLYMLPENTGEQFAFKRLEPAHGTYLDLVF